jgi:hypothetical protein
MQSVLIKWTAAPTAQPRPQCGASRQSAPGHQPPVATSHQRPGMASGSWAGLFLACASSTAVHHIGGLMSIRLSAKSAV